MILDSYRGNLIGRSGLRQSHTQDLCKEEPNRQGILDSSA